MRAEEDAMLLRLSSGLTIAVSPFFFWEALRPTQLTLRARGVFHPTHVTTRLCLELLENTLARCQYRRVLDVGCGCGILAMTAAYRGVPFTLGLDLDPRAVHVSQENARRNRLDARCRWLSGTAGAVRGPFDCVLANLPYAALIELLGDLAGLLGASGKLIFSGFQDVEWGVLEALAQGQGLIVEDIRSGDYTFYGVPPSGSFTWMAVLAHHGRT
jgi:ribosomal protein L11 methylase PrmA